MVFFSVMEVPSLLVAYVGSQFCHVNYCVQGGHLWSC